MSASLTIDRLTETGARHCATCRNCIVTSIPNLTARCGAGKWERPRLTLAAVANLPKRIAEACPDWRE